MTLDVTSRKGAAQPALGREPGRPGQGVRGFLGAGGVPALGSVGARALYAVAAITLLGAAVRFATLDVQSIWGDEAATIHLVRFGFGGMLSHLAKSESTPPLYYVLLWLWCKPFGSGAVACRALSALVGTATIPVAFAAGRRWSTSAGVWFAALTACSPAMLYYSQETRAYALLILFIALAFVAWLSLLDTPTRRGLIWWGAFSCVAVLTHYFALFAIAPQALILIRRWGWRSVWKPLAAVAAVTVAVAPLALAQRTSGQSNWISGTSLPARVAETGKQFLVGLVGPYELYTGAIAGVLCAVAVVALWRRLEAPGRRELYLIAAVPAATVAIPLVLAVVHIIDVFDGRNVIEAWFPAALLVAVAIAMLRGRVAGAAIGGALCVLGLGVFTAIAATPAYQRDDWRDAATFLQQGNGPGRVVVTEGGAQTLQVLIPQLRILGRGPVTTGEIDYVALRTPRSASSPVAPKPPGRAPPGFVLAASKQTDVWAVYRYVSSAPRTVGLAALRAGFAKPDADASQFP